MFKSALQAQNLLSMSLKTLENVFEKSCEVLEFVLLVEPCGGLELCAVPIVYLV